MFAMHSHYEHGGPRLKLSFRPPAQNQVKLLVLVSTAVLEATCPSHVTTLLIGAGAQNVHPTPLSEAGKDHFLVLRRACERPKQCVCVCACACGLRVCLCRWVDANSCAKLILTLALAHSFLQCLIFQFSAACWTHKLNYSCPFFSPIYFYVYNIEPAAALANPKRLPWTIVSPRVQV